MILAILLWFFLATSTTGVEFGHDVLQTEFLLNYTNFNHGSFGACPKQILDYQSILRLQQEQQPDPWMRVRYRQMLNATRRKIADYVNADNVDNLVLLESASTAVNSILRSVKWNPGINKVAYFTTAYDMVKHTVEFLKQSLDGVATIEIVEIPVTGFPISSEVGYDAFLKPMEETLENLRRKDEVDQLRVVILDHILSCPGVKTPLKQLADLVKEYSPHTFVLVDGAHALGQIPDLNLRQLEPSIDAYLSNGHKWFYTPKGSAFLWVKQSLVTQVFPEPTVVSSANRIVDDAGNSMAATTTTSLSERFVYTSTRDYTALLSFDAALDFRRDLLGGDDAIYDYVRNLALTARRYLLDLWNTTALVPEYMEEFMINVGLPIGDPAIGTELQDYLLKQHEMYIIVVQVPTSGLVYTRLSAQVYLEMSDFERLGDAVLEFIKLERRTNIRGRDDFPLLSSS